MHYWKQILAEFLNRDNKNFCFYYTNLRDNQSQLENTKTIMSSSTKKQIIKQYPLGRKFPNTYFTYREAQCMKGFLEGKTCTEIGKVLAISQRTVEFYLINMKKKVKCQRKDELVKKVAQSEFTEYLDF